MKKIIASEYLTLDGVMEDPHWSFEFWDEEAAKYAHDQLFASDVLLLGRVTYEGFAAAWPTMKDEQGFADRMNSLPKFVVSTTLEEPSWNNTKLIQENVVAEIAALKQQPGQDILIYGSGGLIRSLIAHHLIDEYRLWVHPIILGRGKRLFVDGSDTARLKLVNTKTFRSGVIILAYHPNREETKP